MDNEEIWVFLSHSIKDYEKVRQVRDLLEDMKFRPLMFFLKCLNDDDEIDALIKREIDARKRFILCDSPNAQESKWVTKEKEYIKSKRKYYYTIDLREPVEKIAKDLQHFAFESTVWISNSIIDYPYYEQIKTMFQLNWGMRVYDVKNELPSGCDFQKWIKEHIDKCLEKGFVVFIVTQHFLHSQWCMKEMEYALSKGDKKHIIIIRDKNVDKPQNDYYEGVQEYVTSFENGKIDINESWFYWSVMQEQIKKGVAENDPSAHYWLAYHYYWDDDRFDNTNMEGMRSFALEHAKIAMERGHKEAKDLYKRIIMDYPELNDCSKS